MTFSYKSQSGAEPLRKIVVISQTNISSLQCEGRETGGGPAYTIDLSKFIGDFGYHPNPGEEWVICQILGLWTLERRTSFQNNTTLALQTSLPGTSIFSNHGTLQIVDTQVEIVGPPLIVNGIDVTATPSVCSITASSNLSCANGWTTLTFGATADYKKGSALTNSTSGITINTAGRYQVSGHVTFPNSTGTTRGISLIAAGGYNQKLENTVTTFSHFLWIADELSFNAGDLIQLFAYQNNGTTLNCNDRKLTVRQILD